MSKIKKAIISTLLCLRYPFLKLYYLDKKQKARVLQKSCWYYSVPVGWRRISLLMFEEIRRELRKSNQPLDNFTIFDVKEKYGYLDLNTNGTRAIEKILTKYEYISSMTCIVCGDNAFGYTDGWILPYCLRCAPLKTPMHKYGTERDKWYGSYSLMEKGDKTISFDDEKQKRS